MYYPNPGGGGFLPFGGFFLLFGRCLYFPPHSPAKTIASSDKRWECMCFKQRIQEMCPYFDPLLGRGVGWRAENSEIYFQGWASKAIEGCSVEGPQCNTVPQYNIHLGDVDRGFNDQSTTEHSLCAIYTQSWPVTHVCGSPGHNAFFEHCIHNIFNERIWWA